ncbi:MAG: DUF192 domain-containing protein [Bacilli bacterium]|nr:DUF192 domain-containing protein [Bacilli bacterium]
MYLLLDNKKIKIKDCVKFKDRLFGLMFKKNICEGLLFRKCNSIHTFFMFEDIDVIGLDNNDIVIGYKKSLKPYKIFKIRGAKKIIELPCKSINEDILNKKIIFKN